MNYTHESDLFIRWIYDIHRMSIPYLTKRVHKFVRQVDAHPFQQKNQFMRQITEDNLDQLLDELQKRFVSTKDLEIKRLYVRTNNCLERLVSRT